jgi:transposase
MVMAEGLGDAGRQALRNEKVDRRLGARLAVIMHRIWVDGTEFRWTREAALAS